jgi:hypothetical protein
MTNADQDWGPQECASLLAASAGNRYCHPQAEAVEAAFSKFGNRSEVVTDGGHHENAVLPEGSVVVAGTGA